MVSLKLSLAMAATGLQLASARQCTARMVDSSSSPMGAPATGNQEISVWFNDNPDEVLDSQNSAPSQDKHLNIYDGVQTLTSPELGGDVRLWATMEEEPSQGLQRGIGSCTGEYMDQTDLVGEVKGGQSSACDIVFEC